MQRTGFRCLQQRREEVLLPVREAHLDHVVPRPACNAPPAGSALLGRFCCTPPSSTTGRARPVLARALPVAGALLVEWRLATHTVTQQHQLSATDRVVASASHSPCCSCVKRAGTSLCTHKAFTKGRSIFSRSTENGPAFPESSGAHRRSASPLAASAGPSPGVIHDRTGQSMATHGRIRSPGVPGKSQRTSYELSGTNSSGPGRCEALWRQRPGGCWLGGSLVSRGWSVEELSCLARREREGTV